MGKTFSTGLLTNGIWQDSSNNIGIGAANSSYKFQVTGTTNLTGALSGTSATFSGNITSNGNTLSLINASGSADFVLGRANTSSGAAINLNTNGVNKWFFGLRGLVDENFYIYNQTAGANNLILNASTGAATFSSSVTANSLIVNTATGIPSYLQLSINGTAYGYYGIAASVNDFIAGSAIGDLNIRTANSQKILFSTNNGGSAAMLINSSGNVGIGTSSPTNILEISKENTNIFPRVNRTSTTYEAGWKYSTGGSDNFYVGLRSADNANSFHFFSYTTSTSVAQITSGGNLLIATTTDRGYKLQTTNAYSRTYYAFGTSDDGRYIGQGDQISGSFQSYDIAIVNYATSARVVIANSSTGVVLNNGATSWSAFSDERLKNINGSIENAVDKLKSLRAVNFSWKTDKTNKENLGLIAQDIQKVFPQVVDESKSFNEGDDTEYLSVKYTELIPVLVKAIQELKLEIDELKNK